MTGRDDDRAFRAERRAEKWEAAWKIVALFLIMGFGAIFIGGGLDAVFDAARAILRNLTGGAL